MAWGKSTKQRRAARRRRIEVARKFPTLTGLMWGTKAEKAFLELVLAGLGQNPLRYLGIA